ncbi:MAG: lipopolysaccharide biosynthesis protein [Candidatus Hodarchaeota archaeon]
MNLINTIGRNTLFGIAEKIIRISLSMLMIPVVVHYIGLDGFGIWAIIIAAVSYMTMGVGGAGSAFQKYVAESTATGNFTRASKLLSAGFFLVLLFSIVTLVPVALLSAKLSHVIKVPEQFIGIFRQSVSVLAIAMIFCNVGSVYSAIIMGAHRIDLVKTIDSICTLAQSAITLALLFLGFGLVGMVIALAISELVRAVTFIIFSSRVLPDVTIAPSLISYPYLKETLRFAGSYQVYNFLEIAYGGLLPFLVLRFFNPELTGIYAVSRRLVSLPFLVSESFLLPFLSGAAWTYAKGEIEEFSTLISKAMKFTITMLIPALVFISFSGKTILLGLTGHDSHLFTSGLILISGAVIFYSLGRVYCATYRAAGGTSLDVFWIIMKIIIIGIFFVLGTHLWHYNGGLLVYLLAELIGFGFMYLSIKKIAYNINIRPVLLDLLKVSLASFCICAICAIAILMPLPSSGGLRFLALLRAGIAGALFLLMGGYTLWRSRYLSPAEKESVRAVFHSFNLKQFANAKQQ